MSPAPLMALMAHKVKNDVIARQDRILRGAAGAEDLAVEAAITGYEAENPVCPGCGRKGWNLELERWVIGYGSRSTTTDGPSGGSTPSRKVAHDRSNRNHVVRGYVAASLEDPSRG